MNQAVNILRNLGKRSEGQDPDDLRLDIVADVKIFDRLYPRTVFFLLIAE